MVFVVTVTAIGRCRPSVITSLALGLRLLPSQTPWCVKGLLSSSVSAHSKFIEFRAVNQCCGAPSRDGRAAGALSHRPLGPRVSVTLY